MSIAEQVVAIGNSRIWRYLGTCKTWAAGEKPVKIQRTTGLWAGSREAAAAEGLHAHYGSDDIAVYIDVACGNPAGHALDRLVDAGVQPEGQGIAGRIDGIDKVIKFGAFEPQDMQHGAEHLAWHLGDVGDFDDRWRHEGSEPRWLRQLKLLDSVAPIAHLVDMSGNGPLRFCGDNGSDVDRQPVRIAHGEFTHGPLEHRQDTV